jgi:hypothetical protein
MAGKFSVGLDGEAYAFWEMMSDFRRDIRRGVPVDLPCFISDVEAVHELSDYTQIKARCQAALVFAHCKVHLGMQA